MTKADRIRKLYAKGGLTVQQIAEIVGVLDAYVRVVVRQRDAGNDPNARYVKRVYANGNREAARIAAREAYRAARSRGASTRDARNTAGGAYGAAMRRTGALCNG